MYFPDISLDHQHPPVVRDFKIMRWTAFVANILAFSVCASLAFMRNINALFYHYDGSYMFTEARDQLHFGQPLSGYANNFLQSIGNIQFPINAKLLIFYWPIGWFSDLRVSKVVCYVMVAAIVFASTYAMARLLSQPRRVALIAGWIMGFTACPFVPLWYFYPILESAPQFLVLIVAPVLAFWLTSRIGHGSLIKDAIFSFGLLAWAVYFVSAAALLVPMVAIGTVPYVVLAFGLAQSRSELFRKTAAIIVLLTLATLLRWPWFVLGLFLDTSPNFFPADFTVVYRGAGYASVLFQKNLSFAGPLLVISAALGAVIALRSNDAPLRGAAWTTICLIAVFVVGGILLVTVPHWILPPPIYFEIAAWPLYGVFAAVTLDFLLNHIHMAGNSFQSRYQLSIPPYQIGVVAALAIAAVIVLSRRPTPKGYPFPPQMTPTVSYLSDRIGLASAPEFRGRVLTAVPFKADGTDAWTQQFSTAANSARDSGNDEMSLGLWYYRIPTLFEYNQFLSPIFHAFIKRMLQRPPIAHQRNITVLDHPDSRVLQLLGVRYVLMPQPDTSLGRLRATEDRDGEHWGLIELPAPNLATYSPTSVETLGDLAGVLNFVSDDHVDLAKQAVSTLPITGILTPVSKSSLTVLGKSLRLVAESDGRSIVILPLEYSHCLEFHDSNTGKADMPSLLRFDGLLAGILFDRHIDALLSFRAGLLHNQTCRWDDYLDVKAMLP
jgi:hypothetical protein